MGGGGASGGAPCESSRPARLPPPRAACPEVQGPHCCKREQQDQLHRLLLPGRALESSWRAAARPLLRERWAGLLASVRATWACSSGTEAAFCTMRVKKAPPSWSSGYCVVSSRSTSRIKFTCVGWKLRSRSCRTSAGAGGALAPAQAASAARAERDAAPWSLARPQSQT